MNYAYLCTGGNIGNRVQELTRAAAKLQEACGTIVDKSSFYETAAWGKTDQDPFLNQVLVMETMIAPREFLSRILEIEKSMGRKRAERFGSRTIDIDILFYDHLVVNEPGLTIPHPQLQLRRFVLQPLAEIAPAYIHPILHQTVLQLLEDCPDPLEVKKFHS